MQAKWLMNVLIWISDFGQIPSNQMWKTCVNNSWEQKLEMMKMLMNLRNKLLHLNNQAYFEMNSRHLIETNSVGLWVALLVIV